MSQLGDAVVNEMSAMWQVLNQSHAIKCIVVDLDDTLWYGVSGELIDLNPGTSPASNEHMHMIEGWPKGIIEGLKYCKKRGVLLAINSRNDENFIGRIFESICGSELSLSDFSVVKINFEEKSKNMEDIIRALNILPDNILYIDDSPVERSKMNSVFPTMRIVGRYFQYIRSLLLFAPELQVANITAESLGKTEMAQGQVLRDLEKVQSNPEEFLRSLNLTLIFFEISRNQHNEKIQRAVELINKTNQWNSTGAKVSESDLLTLLDNGGRVFGVSAQDKFTGYGDVAFILISGHRIQQFVMSCRVAGLGVEDYFLSRVTDLLQQNVIEMDFFETGKNSPFKFFASRFQLGADKVRIRSDALNDISHINNTQ
jgi:FkbH-like protein